jgi:hypothetical protein
LFSIILRFRKHSVAISADIRKMYRQVLVNPKQRDLQRILWRSSPGEEPSTYEYILNTVSDGTSCAPYLAIRCLYEIGLRCQKQTLWQLNFHWDESIPEDLYTLWLEFQNKLDHLNNIKVPRHITCNEPHHIELHGFSDASEKAYGACIFIKSRASQNHCHVRLLCAKSG